VAKRPPDKLVEDWFGLLGYCNQGCQDKKLFRKLVDAWAKEWSRSTMEEQGYCSEKISMLLKGNMPPPETV
jgi:hypothetical protein